MFPGNTIVLAIGTKVYNSLEAELKGLSELVVIGDAVKPRKAVTAVREGFVAGMNA